MLATFFMPFSDNIFHVFSIDFEAFFVPSKHEKHAFSLRKQHFSQNHPLAKNTIFLSILSSFLVPFSFNFGIVFRYFFGIDFRVTFLATFFDFWCHYRRPRGPTGDLRVAIFAPKGLQKGTTPSYGEPLRSVRVNICPR